MSAIYLKIECFEKAYLFSIVKKNLPEGESIAYSLAYGIGY